MKYPTLAALVAALLLQACSQPNVFEVIRHTVDSDGHPMAVWAKGPAHHSGVVVLVHGRTWSSLPDFDLQVPGEQLSLMDGLAVEGWATYAVDLRGYGSTPRDETGWLSPSRAAADVINVLEWVAQREEPGTRFVLFGWSLGSMVAQMTIQQRPDLVSSLVLYGYPFTVGAEIPVAEDPDDPPREPTTAEAAASDFITAGSISQTAIDTYVAAALEADPVRVDWHRAHEWMALDPSLVTVPTQVLQGEFDPFATTERQLALFTQLGTSDREWVVVAGGDHAAHLEAAREYFIAALVAFIGRPRWSNER